MSLTRRAFLQRSAAVPLCAWLPRLSAAPSPRALILVWLDGGVSHLDTFDGKPEASADLRGDLRSVPAVLEGVFVSEHLPRIGKALARCALVRSVTSGEGNHDRGSHYLLTGHRPSPVLTHPALGSVLAGAAAGVLPAYVAIPQAPEYGREGFLARTHSPFELGGDPAQADFAVRDLAAAPATSRRVALLDRIDALDGAPRSASEAARDEFLRRARALSLDPEARAAFDLAAEPAALRERYGRHRLGQSCLLARRLVARGVRTVLVRDEGWDHHQAIARALTYGFPPKLPALDQALSALLDDLEQTGLCERVVVCVASEFGRTPRLNPAGGRDHWPRAFSVLMYGGGVKRGVVVGRTDARGEEPVERPVGPGDVFASLVAALGADPAAMLRTDDGRPIRLLEDGAAPIAEILAP